jgi:hypothetical protein
MARVRFGVTLVFSLLLLAFGSGQALASHGGGGGGGGGGGTPPPAPSGTPAVTLSPSSVTYGPQDLGTTSAAQTIRVANTGTASLFINGLSQAGIDPLDFAQVDDRAGTVVVFSAFGFLGLQLVRRAEWSGRTEQLRG